ncbi:MAG: hypothetical protein QNI95_11400 [Desulfobacterales bacterium]|nr:hypothetical protein [Desulfobacterales bacterium]
MLAQSEKIWVEVIPDKKKSIYWGDNGGRRSGFDRRHVIDLMYAPIRRAAIDRRQRRERRKTPIEPVASSLERRAIFKDASQDQPAKLPVDLVAI